MPRVKLNARLIRHTAQPQELVALGARLCYSNADIEKLLRRIDSRDQGKFIRDLGESGHLSTFEHASFSFLIEGVSRSLLAQITRHRIASFSVQSQRYVSKRADDGSDMFDYVLPPAIEALGEEAAERFRGQMRTIQSWYNQWSDELGAGEGGNEDARFVLPNACATRMLVTMNARELLHFFSLRCCNRAQWEIRALAWEMLSQAYAAAPYLFENAGPGCVGGPCPEGKKSCGKMEIMKERKRAMMEVTP
jgi:thymidylate synthase (FAD)